MKLPNVVGNCHDKPCHVTTDCRRLQIGKKYLNLDEFNQHSGLSPDNWVKQMWNPIVWSYKIDPIGFEHADLREKLNAQTDECPEGVDGNLLFNSLLMCYKWLVWQVAFPGLVCDRQWFA